jgi:hypothetical protein
MHDELTRHQARLDGAGRQIEELDQRGKQREAALLRTVHRREQTKGPSDPRGLQPSPTARDDGARQAALESCSAAVQEVIENWRRIS